MSQKILAICYIKLNSPLFSMLKMEDKLHSFPFYKRAASEAINIYLDMHDKPITDVLIERLKKVKINSWKQQDSTKVQHKDDDPLGIEYLKTTNPLGQALKLLEPLLLNSPESVETYLLGFEVYFRKDKPLWTLKMVKKALDLNPKNPQCYVNLLRFHKQWTSYRKCVNRSS